MVKRKTFSIIALPARHPSHIERNIKPYMGQNPLRFSEKKMTSNHVYESLDIHFVSTDDEILIGDWFVNMSDYEIQQSKGYGVAPGVDLKIIGTTDSSLQIGNFSNIKKHLGIPKISERFTRHFIAQKGLMSDVSVIGRWLNNNGKQEFVPSLNLNNELMIFKSKVNG